MNKATLTFAPGFHVRLQNDRGQAAEMTLGPGERTGGPDNRHPGSDQWLFVVSGRGTAIVGSSRFSLKAGVLILIPRNTAHEIRNQGRSALRTLNLYVPPTYTAGGNPRKDRGT